jgi:hypothetical protein
MDEPRVRAALARTARAGGVTLAAALIALAAGCDHDYGFLAAKAPLTCASANDLDAQRCACGDAGCGAPMCVPFIDLAAPVYALNGAAAHLGADPSLGVALTDDAHTAEAGSLFSTTAVAIGSFSTDFSFHFFPGSDGAFGDGLTFTIQRQSPTALGGAGSDLGYGGIPESFAVKIDSVRNDADPSEDVIGYFSGGNHPLGGMDISPYVNLHDHDMRARIDYDGTALSIIVNDDTGNTFMRWIWSPVDIRGAIGGETAYVGLTGASGGYAAREVVSSWRFFAGIACSPE